MVSLCNKASPSNSITTPKRKKKKNPYISLCLTGQWKLWHWKHCQVITAQLQLVAHPARAWSCCGTSATTMDNKWASLCSNPLFMDAETEFRTTFMSHKTLFYIRFFFFLSVKNIKTGSSHCSAAETNLTSIYEDAGSILGLDQWVGDSAFPWAVV